VNKLATATKIVLSASRRTDIPAFYLTWFMNSLDRGFFEVANPFNKRVARVPADPDTVDTIVFWSKDFGRFLAEEIGEELRNRGYGQLQVAAAGAEGPAAGKPLGSTRSTESPVRAAIDQLAF